MGNHAETRKLAAILAADVAGYSKLVGVDEERTLARLRALRSDLIDPTVALHHGRVVKRTGDGSIIEFRSVVDAVRCAIEVQNGMSERNAGLPPELRIEFRVGVHLGDVVEESDGDLMGDGVNIASRLEGIAKPGTICLSEDAYRQVKSRLDLAVSDLGATQLKNIAEPVRVYSVEVGKPAHAKPTKTITRKQRSLLTLLGAGIGAVIVVAAGAWYFFGQTRPATFSNKPAHLSIVVLPFANLSGDPDQDYFADGITENLTTELSRIRDSFVIARNTAFTFKNKSIDTKEISKQLGVRYILEGSVQRDQNRVRVNAQLIDGETAAHLWAERFEENVADVFKLQDHVVARLANTLGYELVKAEANRSSRSGNPDSIDLAMRGWSLLYRNLQQPTKEKNEAARSLFEQALTIDSNNSDAVAGDAMSYFAEYIYGWGNSQTDYDAKILGQSDRAIALAPDNLLAFATKSYYLGMSRRYDEAIRAADAGLAINPNYAPLYTTRHIAEMSLGHYEQAKNDTLQAMRLSPRDPKLHWLLDLADVELATGHIQAAIDQYHKAYDAGYRGYFLDMSSGGGLCARRQNG